MALAVIALLGVAAPASADDGAAALLNALVQSQGPGHAVVGALATDPVMSGVPLPSGYVLGSVVREVPAQVFGGGQKSNSVEVYYRVPGAKAAGSAYEARLTRAGYKRLAPGSSFPRGGFAVAIHPNVAAFCGPGNMVSVRSGGVSDDTLGVSVSKRISMQSFDPCTMVAGADSFARRMQSPLPQLAAPAGSTMESSFLPSTLFGNSTATVHTAASPGSTLSAFAAQLVRAGWRAGAKASSPGVASQVFSIADSFGQHWRAALTVASGARAQDAFVVTSREVP